MKYSMRRFKQALTDLEVEELFTQGKTGVLALVDEDLWPYALPLNYVFHDDHIYFHGAPKGHKMEAIVNNPKASFCVVDQDDIISQRFTTRYSSAIAFGTMRIVEDPKEKNDALIWLCDKYCPLESQEAVLKEMEESPHVCILALDIDYATGKGGREFFLAINKEHQSK